VTGVQTCALPIFIGCLAASREIYRIGLGCELDKIAETWTHAAANPIEPLVVENAPCQEIVITGGDPFLNRKNLAAAVDGLQKTFAKFRPEPFKTLPPQQITDTLLAATEEVRKAFGENTTIPDVFFLGFEAYKDSLAREGATGVLNYQIGAARELFLILAAAGPAELRNVHRPPLPEEQGTNFQPGPEAVARALPIEITFTGTESSLREFLTALNQSKNYYFVIRTMRVASEKKTPPLHTDAKFELPKAAASADNPANDPFGGGFVIPGDEEPAAEDEEEDEPAPAPEVQPLPTDSGRILAPVLGTEKIEVFLRIDIMRFLPEKKLPQP
jgi:hypothetical protein